MPQGVWRGKKWLKALCRLSWYTAHCLVLYHRMSRELSGGEITTSYLEEEIDTEFEIAAMDIFFL